MQKLTQSFKTESVIRAIIAILGILTFNISTGFGWGFILGALISKENIDLKTKEGWGLLTLITGVMVLALYFLLDTQAIYGYIVSTISYLILRGIFYYFQNNR